MSGWQQVKRAGSFVWRGNGGAVACWLVILIKAGSSEVGARSPGADVGIAFVCMSLVKPARRRSQELARLRLDLDG